MMGVYIVAEIGLNHNGDIEICKQMINKAKESGADAVKLQIITPKIVSKIPWLVEAQERCMFTFDEYLHLKQHAYTVGIDIFASFADVNAIQSYQDLGFTKIKVSSSNLKNWPLHNHIASLNHPVILSTGDSYLSEVVRVIEFYRSKKIETSLTYCVSQYPTPPEMVMLKTIPFFKQLFNIPIGFSDHTEGTITSVLAVAMGAEIIEKHFTLDKKMEGPDHHFSLDPHELAQLTSQIRMSEKMLGDPTEHYYKNIDLEKSFIRRSIIFKEDKLPGYVIKEKDILVSRPIYHSDNEIPPENYKSLIGCQLQKKICGFEPLEYSHFAP